MFCWIYVFGALIFFKLTRSSFNTKTCSDPVLYTAVSDIYGRFLCPVGNQSIEAVFPGGQTRTACLSACSSVYGNNCAAYVYHEMSGRCQLFGSTQVPRNFALAPNCITYRVSINKHIIII